MTKIVIDNIVPPIKQIHLLWWNGVAMGWSENKDELHEWAKSLDATWENDSYQPGTTYTIITAEAGFRSGWEHETFDILTS